MEEVRTASEQELREREELFAFGEGDEYLVAPSTAERFEPASETDILPAVARAALIRFNFLVQVVPLAMMYRTGEGWWIAISAFALLALVPALDHVLARKHYTLDLAVSEANSRRLLVLQAWYLFGAFLAAVTVAASGRVETWAAVAAVSLVGFINVHVAVTAHDFGHKRDRWNRMVSNMVCAIGGLGYFMPQHVNGHHVHVGTPEDCASAKFGESAYGFIFRAFLPEVMGGFRYEAERLRRKGLPVVSWHNDVLVSYAMSVAVAAVLVAALGWIALPYILLHHGFVWFSLMLNDYIQHYGLMRAMLPNGRREPQSPMLSWSAESPLCNLMTFNVQRHAYHHAKPMLSYQELKYLPTAPTCPTGYFGMMAVAMNPLWWRHMMDPLLVRTVRGNRNRINVYPGCEARLEKLIARYRAEEEAAFA